MYIEPNTNIRLLQNVPLDNTYEHTLYFASSTARANYFIGQTKYNLTGYSYQRVANGIARVGLVADDLYDCNYMMFQNSSFGNRWFYAFINEVVYINNGCSEIHFEIDVMQTWADSYRWDMVFVERQHSLTDHIGDNIIPEPVSIGETVTHGYTTLEELTDCAVIIAVTGNSDGTGYFSKGFRYNGVYSGAQLFVFEIKTDGNVDTINSFLSNYIAKPESILSMYLVPRQALAGANVIKDGSNDWYYLSGGLNIATTTYNLASWKINGDETFGGAFPVQTYTPKNKKLYTYPYNYLSIDNSAGQEINLRYEFFPDCTPQLEAVFSLVQPVVARLAPRAYKNCGTNSLKTETLDITNFPMCSWNNDSFTAWIVQQGAPLAVNTAVGASQVALGATSGIGATSGFLGLATNAISQTYQASLRADNLRGNLNTGCNYLAGKGASFNICRRHIDPQSCKMIDDFFTKYGYAHNQLLSNPNIWSRPHWNYIKTNNCTLMGSVPADDLKKIASIYDKGITFWKNASEVGNYSLDNSPT